MFTISSNRIQFFTHTHSATIPGLCNPDPKAFDHFFPGVTARDVRLAYRVERLWEEHCERRTGVPTHEVRLLGYRTSSLLPINGYRKTPEAPWIEADEQSDVTDVLASIDETTFIDNSSRSRRARREVFVPRRAPRCPACHESHALKTCPVRTKIKPPKNCRSCGGLHWIVDCPELSPTWL